MFGEYFNSFWNINFNTQEKFLWTFGLSFRQIKHKSLKEYERQLSMCIDMLYPQ